MAEQGLGGVFLSAFYLVSLRRRPDCTRALLHVPCLWPSFTRKVIVEIEPAEDLVLGIELFIFCTTCEYDYPYLKEICSEKLVLCQHELVSYLSSKGCVHPTLSSEVTIIEKNGIKGR